MRGLAAREVAEAGAHHVLAVTFARLQLTVVPQDGAAAHGDGHRAGDLHALEDAEVYNSSYEPINQPEVTLILTDENNKQFNYTFSKTGTGYHLQIGMLPPGKYKFKASTNNGTKSFEERGSIIINKLVAEKMQLVADHQLLSQLANKSGGKFYYPEQIDKIYKDLLDNKNIKTISYSQRDLKELIDVKALFFILLALLSLEWFIRKYNGLY